MESKQTLLQEFLQRDKSTNKRQLAKAILDKFNGTYKFTESQINSIGGNVNEVRQYIFENPNVLNFPDKLKNINTSKKSGEAGYEKSADISLNQSNIEDEFEDAVDDLKDKQKTMMGEISRELYLEKPYQNEFLQNIENQDVGDIIEGKDVVQQTYQNFGSKITNKDALQKIKTVVNLYKQRIAEKKVNDRIQAMKNIMDKIPDFKDRVQQFIENYRYKQKEKEYERIKLLQKNRDLFKIEEEQNQKENQEQIDQKIKERKQQLLMNILNRHNLPNPNLQSIVQSIEQPVRIQQQDPSLKYKMINKINQKRVQEENQTEKQKLPDNIQSRISKKTGLRITELTCDC